MIINHRRKKWKSLKNLVNIYTLIPLNLFLASLSTLKAFKITMLFLSNIMQDFVYYNEVFEN